MKVAILWCTFELTFDKITKRVFGLETHPLFDKVFKKDFHHAYAIDLALYCYSSCFAWK